LRSVGFGGERDGGDLFLGRVRRRGRRCEFLDFEVVGDFAVGFYFFFGEADMLKLLECLGSVLVGFLVKFEEREELLFGVGAVDAFEGLFVGGEDGLAGPAHAVFEHADALQLLGLHCAKNQL
jgi:hypothetical protein